MKSKFLAMLLAMVMCLGMLSPAVLATEGGLSTTDGDSAVVDDGSLKSKTADDVAPNPTDATSASEEINPEPDVGLPKVYEGVVVNTESTRTTYTEATRPEKPVLNAVIDNPDYGYEPNFLTITRVSTGEAWRAGTMELISGEQYLVEVYCRNDDVDDGHNGYGSIKARVSMPYEVFEGSVADFAVMLVTNEENISATVRVTAREGVSVQYVNNSLYAERSDNRFISPKWEELFADGTHLITNTRLKAGSWVRLRFSIQIVADETIPAADPDQNYDAILSPARTGFVNAGSGSGISDVGASDSEVEPPEDGPDASAGSENVDESMVPLSATLVVVIAAVIVAFVGGALISAAWRRRKGP